MHDSVKYKNSCLKKTYFYLAPGNVRRFPLTSVVGVPANSKTKVITIKIAEAFLS